MKPFGYLRPSSVADALKLSAENPNNRFFAGGTTLFDLMKLGIETPERIVDINSIQELAYIDTSGSRELVFGALARMSDVAADRRVVKEYPALSESLWRAASQQLRNMASVGGNLLQRTRCAYFRGGEPYACNKRKPGSGCSAMEGIDRGQALLGASASCNAVYPGDFAVALVAFDAQVDVVSRSGSRTILLEKLHREPGDTPHIETTLAPDELIVRIRVPVTRMGRGSTYLKIRDRESYAFALTSAAVALVMSGSTVKDARIAIGGVATRPWRARVAEQSLIGRALDAGTARAAGEAAMEGARPGAHNGFKVELMARTVADALMIAKERV
jgi:xanthine dehydrogenase YagS FAD-binding subunit